MVKYYQLNKAKFVVATMHLCVEQVHDMKKCFQFNFENSDNYKSQKLEYENMYQQKDAPSRTGERTSCLIYYLLFLCFCSQLN